VRPGAAARNERPRLGFDGGDALPRHSGAPRRHREPLRGRTGGSGDPELDDRDRASARSERSGGRTMNGPQDLGGRHGFGPVAPEKDEPIFHAPWERRALAVTLAAGAMGHWSLDEG